MTKKTIGYIVLAIAAVYGFITLSKKTTENADGTPTAAPVAASEIKAMTNEEIRGLTAAQVNGITAAEALQLTADQKAIIDNKKDQYVIAEKKEVALSKFETDLMNMSQAKKNEMADWASQIYTDCKGWNAHGMNLYEVLAGLNDVDFYYLVRYAWKTVDGWALKTRLNDQNWSQLNKWSTNRSYTLTKARALIAKIVSRIDSLPA